MLSFNLTTSAAATAHLTAASTAYDDQNPCGTPVPGHPPRPKSALEEAALGSRFDKAALNPQPLPPAHGAVGGRAAFGGDEPEPCGNVPRRFPPPPPPPWVDQLGQPALGAAALARAAAGRHG